MHTKFHRSGPSFYNDGGLWENHSMFFGGGAPPAPAPPDYVAQANAQAITDKQNNDFKASQAQLDYTRQQEAAQRADATAAQQKADKLQQFQQDLNTAYGGAQNYGKNQVATLGLTEGKDYGLLGSYEAALAQARSMVPSSGVDDVGKYINPQSIWDTANKQTLATQRNKMTNQYNEYFAPDFYKDQLNDTTADATLDDILAEQQGEARSALDAAIARGTINTAGRTIADKQLNKQSLAARNKLNDVESGVLSKYQKSIDDTTGRLGTRIANWNYGDPLDLNREQGNVNDLISKSVQRLPGDIYSAVGDTNYFDTDTILGRAGNGQGLTNPTNILSGAIAGVNAATLADKDKNKTTGTIGNAGVI